MGTAPTAASEPRRGRPGGGKTERTAGTVQSLVRAISILNALSRDEHGLTLSDLAQTVGLAPSTTHRMLTTLQQERLVRFDAERSVWTVGVQAFVIGNAFLRSRNLIAIARPFMRRLMETCGETVNLAVEERGEAIYLAQVECGNMMRAITRPGGRASLHNSGVGKAMLAAMPDAYVRAVLQSRGLPKESDKTITSVQRLRGNLAAARKRGFAVDDEEAAVGLRCVASVIFDETAAPLAAISLSGPKARITDERIAPLGAKVVEVARQITAEMGGRVPG